VPHRLLFGFLIDEKKNHSRKMYIQKIEKMKIRERKKHHTGQNRNRT